jgi:hypothetical protein
MAQHLLAHGADIRGSRPQVRVVEGYELSLDPGDRIVPGARCSHTAVDT